MIHITDITCRKKWDKFVTSITPFTFFQSWDWGEYHRKIGNSIYRFGISNSDDLIGLALVIKIKSRKGSFLHLRHGPLLYDWTDYKVIDVLLEHLKKIGNENGIDFIRISPLIEYSEGNSNFFAERNFKESPLYLFDVAYSWNLDLDQSEEKIFSKMPKNTRNIIRRSIREGISIRSSNKIEDLIEFNGLRNETNKNKGFASSSNDLIETEFNIMSRDNNCLLWFSEFKSQPIAGAMLLYYGNQAFYHWGGSSKLNNNIPSSYLLHWEAIKDAKKRGCNTYNFWGVSPPDNNSHPWYGLSLFKKKFGGYLKHYLHAQDLPLTYNYYINYVIENVRKWQYKL